RPSSPTFWIGTGHVLRSLPREEALVSVGGEPRRPKFLAEPPPTRIHTGAEPTTEPPAQRRPSAQPARWISLGAACAAGLVVWLYAHTVTVPRTIPGLRVARASIGATSLEGLDLRVDDVTRAYLEQPVRFRLRGDVFPAIRREVGFLVDREA